MNETQPKRAVVLLSGGLDSATTLAIARDQGYDCAALSFRYGQRHAIELEAAERLAQHYGVSDHRIVNIDLRQFGHSALTDEIDVPKGRSVDEMAGAIPVTYVPARNIIFLSFALAHAEVCERHHIFIGVNALDYSGYPDCRPAFMKAYAEMARQGLKTGVEGRPVHFHTPLIEWSKAEIVQRGHALGVPYEHTHSCYDPTSAGEHCGLCDSCQLRKKGFHESGVPDPTSYSSHA
ncbi:MAG: 7-cyano-7-deazaguanine synthase QueC [Candidatus Hinthialibacter antarcticus]|nr:7-cyano-7-deazaguanine synthase QueC [Candidatus Hinthialibacter antarcticus]